MGQMLVACAGRQPQLEVVAQTDLGIDARPLIDLADVVIDFSEHSATGPLATLCAEHGKALVIGTTGHTDPEKELIRAVASRIPMVWASNYSLGVNALYWLARKAAEILGTGFDIEIVEMHHRHKVDAPSGTAKELVRRIARVRGLDPAAAVRHGREGLVGARGAGEIGMHALRGGSIVGEHRAHFLADGEEIVLEHRALDRDILVRGALRAARWLLADRPAGRYDMGDVLRLA